MILRPYQLEAVARTLPALRDGRRVCLVAPTGSGKTVMGAEIVRRLAVPTRWTAHRRELIAQARAKLPATCGVFSVQERKTHRAELLVVDECFPAGTMVDGRPIDSVRVGDLVSAFDDQTGSVVSARVVRTMNRAPSDMVAVHVDGRVIHCTPEHPFWTDCGWVPARLLHGCMVFTITHAYTRNEMRNVLQVLDRLRMEEGQCSPRDLKSLLLRRMQGGSPPEEIIGDDGRDESQVRLGAHDGAESNAARGRSREGQDVASCDGMEAARPSWQWDGADRSATRARVVARMADGSRGSDQGQAIGSDASDLLQTGHRESDAQDRNRSGRELALRVGSEGAGRKEGRFAPLARVDRVAFLQRGSDGTFGGVCPDGLVYNLEVEGVHTYTADGVIVHNCHHATSSSYRRHLDAHTGPVLGLTATPFRLDGRGLGEVFSELIVATTAAELVHDGTLIEPRYYSVGNFDATKLRKQAGDYRTDDAAAAMDKPRVIGDAVTEYRERAPGTRAVAFCVTVDHAEHVAAAFNAAGIRAEVVHGDMRQTDRDAVLARLADGTTSVVANCMILTEGWDLPTLETAIVLRPTTSLCLHLQMLGRVMRSAEGKTGAIVLDHAGNVNGPRGLGRATDAIEYSLDGCTRRASSSTGLKTCPQCYAIIPVAVNPCECGHTWGAEEQLSLIVDGIGGADRLQDIEAPPIHDPGLWADLSSRMHLKAAKSAYSAACRQWPIVSADGRLLDPASEEGRKREYFDLLLLANEKGYKPGFAAHRFNARFGSFPPRDWGEKFAAWMEAKRSQA